MTPNTKVTVALAAILAAVQVLAGVANLTDLVGSTVAAWIVVAAGVLQAVTVVVTNGQVGTLKRAVRASHNPPSK